MSLCCRFMRQLRSFKSSFDHRSHEQEAPCIRILRHPDLLDTWTPVHFRECSFGAGGLRAWAAKHINAVLSKVQPPQLALEHVAIRNGDVWVTFTGEAIPRHIQNVDMKLKLGRDYHTLTLDVTGGSISQLSTSGFCQVTLITHSAEATFSRAAHLSCCEPGIHNQNPEPGTPHTSLFIAEDNAVS